MMAATVTDNRAAAVSVVHPAGTEPEWRSEISDALARGVLVVMALERPSAARVLKLLSRSRSAAQRGPTRAELESFLEAKHAAVLGRFSLWPSADRPRLAFQQPSARATAWAQRAAVLGGGGRRIWSRALARSFFFTPFALLLEPAVALVVEPVDATSEPTP